MGHVPFYWPPEVVCPMLVFEAFLVVLGTYWNALVKKNLLSYIFPDGFTTLFK